MKLTIVTTVLLGLLLTPALADNILNVGNENSSGNNQYINVVNQNNRMLTRQINVDGGFQTLSIHVQRRVATIEQESTHGLWETVANFNTGVVASKVLPERVCYVSKVNRIEMPDFDEIVRLIQEGMDLESQRHPAKKVTFVIERRVHDLSSYGQDVVDLCRGLPTFVTRKVNGPTVSYGLRNSPTAGHFSVRIVTTVLLGLLLTPALADYGTITTKVLPQRVCYISKVIRWELPRFDELPGLAEEVMYCQQHDHIVKHVKQFETN
ncbi:gastrokine-1-like [Phaenicophaeus curvirostris]|uniref:gastrokine-1-like n=1 Tax=Phaenicophaeus curvirostris TaxID=33595 RepID=UPI0037F0A69D